MGCRSHWRIKTGLHARQAAFALKHGPEIGQNLGMIKNKGLRQGVQRIKGRVGRIVPGLQSIGIEGLARKGHGQRVLPGVAVWAGIHAQKTSQFHIQPGFFAHFAHGGGFCAFALFNKPAGQCKTHRLVGAANDHHSPVGRINDHIRSGRGVSVAGIWLAAVRTGNLAFDAFSVWGSRHRA